MSALSKIRENVGLVIILIAISLAAFILTDLFTGLGGVSVDTTAGEVAGTDIDIQALTNKTQSLRDRYSGDPSIKDSDIDQQAWSDILRDIIYTEEWSDLGMFISDEELNMLYYGPNVHPLLLNDPTFRDSTGRYSPALVQNILSQVEQLATDPNAAPEQRAFRAQFIELRNVIKRDRMNTKWTQMIASAQMVSDNEARRALQDQGRTVNFSYVSVPYASVPNDQVQVTDEDFQNYFDENKAAFKTNGPTARIKYTYFPLQPSEKDKNSLMKEMESNYKKQFGKVANPFEYARSATNVPTLQVDTNFKSIGDLPAALGGVTQLDSVIGPVETDYGLGLYRLVESRVDSNYSVELRHIMVRPQASAAGPITAQDSADARQKARDLRNQILADRSQFAALAAENSDDGFTAGNGGELGWIDPQGAIDFSNPNTQNDPTLGGDFRDDAAKASVGSVFVTNSGKGYHVVEVLDRSNVKYTYAEIGRDIKVSSATRDSVYKRAGQYAGQAKSGASMDSLLRDFREANTNLTPVLGTDVYDLQSGELEKPREMIAWAFQAEPGELSQRIFDAGNAFVVAKVRAKSDGDYLPVDAIKDDPTIRLTIQNEKKAQIIMGKLGGGSDLAQIASAYGAGATTGSAQNVSFASNAAGPLGEEPKVVGRAHGMAKGEISAPIEGLAGVYVIKVESVNDPGETMEAMVAFQKQNIQNQSGQQAVRQSQQAVFHLANIKDYRYQFDYREDNGRR